MFNNIDDDVENGDGDVSSGFGFSKNSTNVTTQVPLRIFMGVFTRVMLVVDMVI